jgi:hypothetical protein
MRDSCAFVHRSGLASPLFGRSLLEPSGNAEFSPLVESPICGLRKHFLEWFSAHSSHEVPLTFRAHIKVDAILD